MTDPVADCGAIASTRDGRLALFVVASVALHALLLATAPDFLHRVLPDPLRTLEVSLRSAEPLPVAAPVVKTVAAAKPEPSARPKPLPSQAAVPVISVPRAANVPAADLPAARAVTETAENPVAVPEPRRDAPPRDAAPITPASFNAAYLQNPPPRYPAAARRSGEQGTVTLKVLVTRDGIAASVAVERSSGFSMLDNAALEAVKTWRFVPARQGAQPVEAWVLVPVVFRLESPG